MSEVAWAGGLFDGEGCLTERRTNQQDRGPQISWALKINMTDEDSIRRFAIAVDMPDNVMWHHPPSHRKAGKQAQWHWRTYKRDEIKRIVEMLYPWVNARRQEKFDGFLNWWNEVGPARTGRPTGSRNGIRRDAVALEKNV